jgi:hypothetical protein
MCEGHGGDLHMSVKDNFCLEGWVSSTLCELWFSFHCALDAHGHLWSFESDFIECLLNIGEGNMLKMHFPFLVFSWWFDVNQ